MHGILQSLLAGFDPDLPLERARTIPNTWYTAPEVYTAERDAVFARTWQVVGRVERVKEAGSFLTAEIAGEPVVVVRGDDGVLRGFFNVCRHRAAPILTEPCGTATKLRCRYHGWTYDLAGKLRGTPEFDGVEEFPKEQNGLPPVAVAEWGPFVWVNLTEPREPLAEVVRPLASWVEARGGFGDLRWYARKTYDLACNWKVYVDNYLDGGYHVNTVHPGLAGVLDYRDYRTVCDGKTVLQSSPMKPAEGDAGRTRTGDVAAYWWVYPNFMLNLYAGVMDTNLVLPLGVDRCRVVFDFYFAAGTADDFMRESVAVADRVQAEDAGICEEVQRGLNSRSYTTGRFSVKRENGGYYFHQLLGRSPGEHQVGEGARFRSGLLFGLVAYLWWGLVPLYFVQLRDAGVGALEILAQRITWSLPVLLLLTAALGTRADLVRVLRSRKLVLVLLASSLFLAANWLLYIYATVTGRVTEASLGYYMMPLVNAALATTVLGERLRPLHYPALALVAVGVAIPFVAAGSFTWIAVLLPVTFAIYGLIRKVAPVESTTGLTVESLLMLPPSLAFLAYLSSTGENHFAADWRLNGLLALSGIVTVVPLLAFTASVRRVPLLAVSFMQFISPTVQMLIAVTLLGETLTPDRTAAFACVWAAVALFVVDAVWQARAAGVRREPLAASRLIAKPQAARVNR